MKAHELLSDRRKWCQGSTAKAADGNSISVDCKAAVAFCARGAIYRCYQGSLSHQCDKAMDRAYAFALGIFGKSLAEVNDYIGYEAVMQVLRDADV